MKRILFVPSVLVLLVAGAFASPVLRGQTPSAAPGKNAEQTEDDAERKESDNAPIVKLSLYKNGFGFVTREIAPRDWSEPLVLDSSIAPRHGTLWFDPAETLFRRTTRKAAPKPKNTAPGYGVAWRSLTDIYEWQHVTLKKKDGTEISGLALGTQEVPSTSVRKTEDDAYLSSSVYSYLVRSSSSYSSYSTETAKPKAPVSYEYVTVQTDDGAFVTVRREDISEIRSKTISDDKEYVRRGGASPNEEAVEEIQIVQAPEKHSGPVTMRYLSSGFTWSPFYRMNLRNDGRMTISMTATLMNTVESFENAEVELISGFPNMAFANALSSVTKRITLSQFIQSLASGGNGFGRSSGGVMGQAASVLSNSFVPDPIGDIAIGDIPDAEADRDDIQYKSLGKLTMNKGDTLYIPIATKDADYEQVVVWSAPLSGTYSRGRSDKNAAGPEPWSAIHFRNPFDFALTTAPYEIERDGKVFGQSVGTWYSPGAPAEVRMTRALTVSCTISDKVTGNRDRVFTEHTSYGTNTYPHPDVTAEIVVVNRGAEAVKMIIDSVFYGELLKADGNPKQTRLSSDSLRNDKNKLVWEITVPANEKITLSYVYSTIKNYY